MVRRIARASKRGTFLLAALLLVACAKPYFSVDDAVRFENGQTRMVAFAQDKIGWRLKGISDVEVRFLIDGREVSSAVTDERGFAKSIVDIDEPTDRFGAAADFRDESFRGEGRVFAWRSDRVIVGCDIDSTISDTSLGALFFHEFDTTSKPIEGSPETLKELSQDYHVLYVTARPRFALAKTQRWLEENGYPREPVVTSLTVGDAIGQTEYKTRTLRSLRKHYTNMLIGIGNTDIDARSYAAHGMLILLVQPEREVGREGNIFRFQSWAEIGTFFRENHEVLSDQNRLRAAIRGEETLRLRSPEASVASPQPAGTSVKARSRRWVPAEQEKPAPVALSSRPAEAVGTR